jgi:hypothetical protein
MPVESNYWARVQKGLVQRLVKRGDNVTAAKLLDCCLDGEWVKEDWGVTYYKFRLLAQESGYDYLLGKTEEIVESLNDVLTATDDRCHSLVVGLVLPEVEDEWREHLRAALRGDRVKNQGVLVTQAPYEYAGLHYRSVTETKIAAALDRAKVLYLPLPVVCYHGKQREPDFLVRSPSGHWGILEVQGEPYHPASTAAQDHERARGFRHFGIPVEFYDAERCYADPDAVVKDFLAIIAK